MDLNDRREAVFRALFDEAGGGREIEKIYLPGTIAHIRANDETLYNEILLTEMRLEHLWLEMRKGKDTFKQFKATLKEWKDLHLKAIDLYRKQRDRKEGEQGSLF